MMSVFHQKHKELYTFELSWVPVEIRNLRLIARLKRDKLDMLKITTGSQDPSAAIKRSRQCYFNGTYRETPVYDSKRLKAGNIIKGPSIIEVPTTTAVIPDGFECRIDDYHNYIMTRGA
jgi:N-methylhydantoinase A